MFDKYNEYSGKGTSCWKWVGVLTVVVNWYDVRQLNRPYSRMKMKKFFNNATIKTLLHVPQHIEFTTNDLVVFHFLKADIMRSTAHLFPRLLSNLKVMLYQGYLAPFSVVNARQFDFRDGVASQTAWLSALPWKGMAAFKEATRKVWHGKDGIIAGYVTHSTNLTRVVLTNAGHMSPGYVTLDFRADR